MAKATKSKKVAEATEKQPQSTTLTIAAPDLRIAIFRIKGTAPYMANRFAAKAEMMMKQAEGSTAKSKKVRAAKDFKRLCHEAQHLCTGPGLKGEWPGLPAPALRAAMIRACSLVGFHMSKAKMSVFVLHDGLNQDGQPCIRLESGPYEMNTAHVRNATGVADVRARPMWRKWEATVRIRYDAGQFTETDVAHLLMRAGMQVGIGEGRPDSKSSAGMGLGTFEIVNEEAAAAAE